ncbi:hypothetical protein QFA96_07550 [Pseudomonas sp. Ap32]|nr:hypothetical protein QFA96_07550 [Pseudomonas sp. Ap32]
MQQHSPFTASNWTYCDANMDVMNPPTRPHVASKTLYRWQSASLESNLHALAPQWCGKALQITTEPLGANASFVNYVRHHRLVDPCTGQPVEIVEKSIRKVALISSQEARFHRAEAMLAGSTNFRYPACLGVIETPWESLIFTEFVRGKPPHMHVIAKQLAHGIAELESLSHEYLEAQPLAKAPYTGAWISSGRGSCCALASILPVAYPRWLNSRLKTNALRALPSASKHSYP